MIPVVDLTIVVRSEMFGRRYKAVVVQEKVRLTKAAVHSWLHPLSEVLLVTEVFVAKLESLHVPWWHRHLRLLQPQ